MVLGKKSGILAQVLDGTGKTCSKHDLDLIDAWTASLVDWGQHCVALGPP